MDNIENLKRKVTSDIDGIIWLTDLGLEQKPGSFHSLDYLFDGLIKGQDLSSSEKKKSFSLFKGTNFHKSLYLIHLPVMDDLNAFFSNAMEIVDQQITGQGNFLILNESQSGLKKLKISNRIKDKFKFVDFD